VSKYLCRIECDHIAIFKLKKGPRQMVSVSSRLYRMDDCYMTKDLVSDDAMMFYEIDDTQPIMVEPKIVDPDMTRALIDSAKLSGSKKSIWSNISGSHLMEYMTVIIVCGALLYGFLVSGGH